jgi:adenosine deaminase
MNPDKHSEQFMDALQKHDIQTIKKIPKSDLHAHFLLSARLPLYYGYTDKYIPPPPSKMDNIQDLNNWINTALSDTGFAGKEGTEYIVRQVFRQIKESGITVAEMSIDVSTQSFFNDNADELVKCLDNAHKEICPDMDFRPEMGITRAFFDGKTLHKWTENFLATGYFKSIDIYSQELGDNYALYKPYFRMAQSAGLKLKAHAGEFGDADLVKYAVETLELEAVQHGISAAYSDKVTKWLADNNISLNICPTSNVVLSRVENLQSHPIRKLFDNGVKVTINSDDLAVFDADVNDEYLKLYKAGVFNAKELDIIRLNGLPR